jgi:serine protease Do
MGIVSATGRANVGVADYEDFIQTDAAINPGNSGGALVNLKGELIGINTAIVSRSGGYQGIGFAIPSNMARLVMDSLIKHGKVVRGWLGVVIQDIDKDLADAMDLQSSRGVLVSDVTKDSPAEKAGIERSDVLTKLNGEEINSTGQLRNLVATSGAGATVTINVIRDNEQRELTITLGEMPEDLQVGGRLETEKGLLGGLTLAPLNGIIRDQFDIPRGVTHGVVVADIKAGSPAQQAGIRAGDVILEIDRAKIESVEAFKKAYQKAKDRVLLLVYRDGTAIYMALTK